MLAEPPLADVAPPALPLTAELWAVPAGFPSSDPDTVPLSAEEAAASAAYRARKRRHAHMARDGVDQPRFHASRSQAVASLGAATRRAALTASKPPGGERGPRDHEENEGEASAGGPVSSAAGPRGSAAPTLAGNAEWGPSADAREGGAVAARDCR